MRGGRSRRDRRARAHRGEAQRLRDRARADRPTRADLARHAASGRAARTGPPRVLVRRRRAAGRRGRQAAPPGRLRADLRHEGRHAAHDHGLPHPGVGRLPADAVGANRGAGAGPVLLGGRQAAARGRRRLRVGGARPPLHRGGRQGPGSRVAAPALPAQLHRLARGQHARRLRLPPGRRRVHLRVPAVPGSASGRRGGGLRASRPAGRRGRQGREPDPRRGARGGRRLLGRHRPRQR